MQATRHDIDDRRRYFAAADSRLMIDAINYAASHRQRARHYCCRSRPTHGHDFRRTHRSACNSPDSTRYSASYSNVKRHQNTYSFA